MTAIYCYMFEAKSIQSYIFRTGKLRDVIATSERLEQLIDTDENSILSRVLEKLKKINSEIDIKFVRRKGGAFYAYGNEDDLLNLRKVWTLTVQQLFPSMAFIDAMGESQEPNGLIQAMENAQKKMAANRNKPTVKMPLYRANMQLSSRTSRPAVSYDQLLNEYVDNDTHINRHVYSEMKEGNYSQFLYKKFSDSEKSPFPLNLEPTKETELKDQDFPYINENHDLALIHIDGNGIGLLLLGLIKKLEDKSNDDYANIFLTFSDILGTSTSVAAKCATKETIEKHKGLNNILPMRPLIMGGDDITLFCRADLAIDYAKSFCLEFEKQTQQRLDILYEAHNLKGLPTSLTASGGIIFQKATQPFIVAHQLVEELCNQAKLLTKEPKNAGSPALAFMRIATAQDDNYKRIFKETCQVKSSQGKITTALGCYLVTEEDSNSKLKPQLDDLIKLVDTITKNDSPVSINKFRQVLGNIHSDNLSEAHTLIQRLEQRKEKSLEKIKKLFCEIEGQDNDNWWLWNNKSQTILTDITTLAKYKGEEK